MAEGANVIGTLMSGTTNQNETWRFVHGPGLDDPLYGVLKKTDGTYREYLYVTDGNGRQFVVAPENGQMGAFYPDITDWGGSLAGATGKSFTFDANRHTMSAGGTVSSFRNRLYDQATGRWAQEDPIGVAGGVNLYQFNGNNPVMFTDPFGLCDDKKDPECVKVGSVKVGLTVGTKQKLKVPGLLHAEVAIGLTGEAGTKRTLNTRTREQELEPTSSASLGLTIRIKVGSVKIADIQLGRSTEDGEPARAHDGDGTLAASTTIHSFPGGGIQVSGDLNTVEIAKDVARGTANGRKP